jgi:hypothetical protein
MKDIKVFINENIKRSRNFYDVERDIMAEVPGKKRRKSIRCYNCNAIDEENVKLDFDDQIIFKYYCLAKWGCVENTSYPSLGKNWIPEVDFTDYSKDTTQKNKYDFYFDDVDCVDVKTDKNIKGVKCNGKMTFKEARERLEEYFNIKH